MAKCSLICHAETPSKSVFAIWVTVDGGGNEPLSLKFDINGNTEALAIPNSRAGGAVDAHPTDGLWQHLCVEMFVRSAGDDGYSEFNYSPDGKWAVYHFDDYRFGMRSEYEAGPEHIKTSFAEDTLLIDVSVGFAFGMDNELALSAVIEEKDGTKSYWALRHPPGKPDFHHPDCFALTLAAPDEA